MDKLLNPNSGVFALTVVNFLLLVWLLHKFAWKGIIGALDRREKQIADDKAAAATARQEAEQIKAELDARLQNIATEAAKKMQETVSLGQAQKEQMLADAKAQTERLLAQAKEQIEAEKQQVLKEVRTQIVETALLAATKITRQQVTQKTAQASVDEVLEQIRTR